MRHIPYCRKEHYEALYASYLRSDPNELLDAAGIPPGGWPGLLVLDLCGGNGRLSLAARKRGAEVRMVDADGEMCDSHGLGKQGVDVRINSVELMLQERMWLSHSPLFGAVFCQQAVNYWLTRSTAKDVAQNMVPGGVFVFNTFNTLPSTVPAFRERDMGDHYEYEALHSVRGVVHHVQLREGYAPHVTSFMWIPPDEFERILSPHFEIERRTNGRTDIYVCRARRSHA